MTSDKRSFLNTPPLFNDRSFNVWQAKFRVIIQNLNHELWETIVNILFIPTHQVDDEVVDKSHFLWTVEGKRKINIDLKINNFTIMSLDDSKFYGVHHCKNAKEMWDTLDMIYGVSLSIK